MLLKVDKFRLGSHPDRVPINLKKQRIYNTLRDATGLRNIIKGSESSHSGVCGTHFQTFHILMKMVDGRPSPSSPGRGPSPPICPNTVILFKSSIQDVYRRD